MGQGDGTNDSSGNVQGGSGTGDAGCSTLGTDDPYSDCTQHNGVYGKSPIPNYYS